ncbi:MAG TPA: hypothetical protein ENG78_04940 [Acidiferrobacteraceae bacterium]|nr:hypothetical protein [Acidiferrobacteraceae bacterium]HEX20147.1 hypothetical protein [Acidiferrobacteraceae bacterium]
MQPLIKKSITTFAIIIGVGFVGYWGIFLYLVSTSPLTYEQLDLNRDGKVSFTEAEYASNYGMRIINQNGKECIEYYAYKDGLPLKVVCDG